MPATLNRRTPSPDVPHDAFFGAWLGPQPLCVVGMQGHYRKKARHIATGADAFVALASAGQLGLALMEALLAHVRACRELLRLDRTVAEVNHQARRFCERCGFSAWFLYPNAVLMDGAFADKGHMMPCLR